MKTLHKRATVYFDPKIHRVLKIKSIETGRTVSDIVNDAIRYEMELDREDLQVFDDRRKEKTVSYKDMLKELKKNGKI